MNTNVATLSSPLVIKVTIQSDIAFGDVVATEDVSGSVVTRHRQLLKLHGCYVSMDIYLK